MGGRVGGQIHNGNDQGIDRNDAMNRFPVRVCWQELRVRTQTTGRSVGERRSNKTRGTYGNHIVILA